MAEGGITSSADRMVGADHAEVRYFTRYVQAESIFCVFIANNFLLQLRSSWYLESNLCSLIITDIMLFEIRHS